MIIGIPRETRVGETRVAATPETVKKLAASGKHEIVVEAGAGVASSIPDADYQSAGARIGDAAAALGADIVLKVRGPSADELPRLKRGALLIGLLDPFDTAAIASYAQAGVSGYALEWLPRISRAQSMDVLSSQANIAGYKAVIIAANEYGRFMPMLMTAAGTVKAARVLILGVGVAGLQAIATAKRLGAVIEASDVRPSVKDQVESLGAKWVDVPYANDEERKIAEGVGGYARPMPPEWMARQAGIISERCKTVDILITTALIPGRPAPKLIKADTVAAMKPGAIDRRSRGRAGRQRRRLGARQDRRQERRQDRGSRQPAGAGAGRRERALCAQRAQLSCPVAQRQDRRIRRARRRRDHQGHAGVRERAGRTQNLNSGLPVRGNAAPESKS